MSKLNIGKDLYLKGRIGWQGLSKDEYLVKSDYKIINATALMDGYVDWNNCGYITKERYDEAKEIQLQENDILISKDGTLGKIGYVKNLTTPCSVASGIFVLRNTKPDLINFDYLYHVLKSPIFKDFIKRNKAQGSTIPHLYQRDLENFEIEIPNFETQTKISNVLNLIEKKIALNNQIIDALTSLSKTLYDYWFIQFDFPNDEGKPYKSSGGRMVWNERLKREIPEGWKVDNLMESSLCGDIKAGVDYFETKNYLPTANINGEEITDGEYISFDNRESRANMQPVKNSVWFAKMKNSIKHLTIPENSDWFINKYILSTGFQGLKCSADSLAYIHCIINSNWFEVYKDMLSHGATQESVNNEDLKNIKFAVPSVDVLKRFSAIVFPILEKKFSIIKENQELTALRDFLLPLLMNGQVTFKE